TDQALEDLRTPRSGPHYLWLHYLDAHSLLHPTMVMSPSASALAEFREEYLRNVSATDAQIGRILDELSASGRMARTVVILTADHGEGFGEHKVVFHTVTGFEPLVHVPGMIVAPGLQPIKYSGLTSHRDLYATLLGAFGLADRTLGAEQFGRS